jgi:hypothetical protein
MAYVTRGEQQKKERDFLIAMMKHSKVKTLKGFKSHVESQKKKIQSGIKKLEKMPEEEFRQRVSYDVFGVAMKGFYTSQAKDNIKALDNVGGTMENLIRLRCSPKYRDISKYHEKEIFKGRAKEGLKLLDQFTPKHCRKSKK